MICECEECVAARKWIVEKTGVGGGTRPLSSLIASHDYMATEREKYRVSLKKQNELVDRLVAERKERLGTCGTWRHGSIEELPHPQRPTCSNWLPGYEATETK